MSAGSAVLISIAMPSPCGKKGLLPKILESQLRLARLRLVLLDQIANTLRVFLAMPVADDGIGAAGGFDDNLRPENAGRNVHRRDLRHRNALFVAPEQARFHAADPLRADDELRRKNKVALRPAARGEGLGGRGVHRTIGNLIHSVNEPLRHWNLND